MLGPGMATALVVGNVIGAGIFLKPGEAAEQAGTVPVALAAWAAGGVLCLLGALTVAELALRLPQAGGLYVYLREAFGRPVGFLFGWSEFVFGVPASIGALAAGVAGMIGAVADMAFNVWLEAVFAVLLIAILCAVNVAGVVWGGRTQFATTIVKCLFLAGLAALPVVLTIWGYEGIDVRHFADRVTPAAGNDASLPVRFSGALLAVLWAYSGWHVVAPVAEEIKSPGRNIPIALVGGGLLLTALYLAVVLAYHGTLSMEAIRDAGIRLPQAMTDRLLTPFGETVAAAAVTGISLAAIVSMAGSLNANLIGGPRVGFAMARDRVFPRMLAAVHPRYRTPATAIIAQSSMSVLLVILSAALVASFERFHTQTVFELLSNYVTFIATIFLTLAVAAIFPIRKRMGRAAGYATPFYPWAPLIYVAASVLFIGYILVGKPAETITGIALTLAGLPVYWWMMRRRSLPRPSTANGD